MTGDLVCYACGAFRPHWGPYCGQTPEPTEVWVGGHYMTGETFPPLNTLERDEICIPCFEYVVAHPGVIANVPANSLPNGRICLGFCLKTQEPEPTEEPEPSEEEDEDQPEEDQALR